LILRRDDHRLELTGSFAAAVRNQLQGDSATHPLLKRIETAHPWLAGLADAKRVEHPDPATILGTGLGMLFVEVTNRCNERCIHCYADSSPERDDMLPAELVRKGIDEAFRLGRPYIQFTGGDPLIHPDLVELVSHAHKKQGPGIEIYTNGLLLHAPLLAALAPFAPRFCFSLYSCDAAVHDAITLVPGSLSRTLAAIRRTQERGLEVRIGIALMQDNADTLEETLRFLHEELGITPQHVRIDPVHATGRGGNVRSATGVAIVPGENPHAPATEGEHGRSGKLCIAANGDVYPCIFSRQILLGNLNTASLPDMLQQLPTGKTDQTCLPDLGCHDCRMIALLLGA